MRKKRGKLTHHTKTKQERREISHHTKTNQIREKGKVRPTVSEVVPSARHGSVAVAEPVFSKSPHWTMSAAPR